VPRQWPRGCYDLLLLSESVYYWDEADLAKVAGWRGGTARTITAEPAAPADIALPHGAAFSRLRNTRFGASALPLTSLR
jgi:hypothetical protein